jgi:exodeoxyribonuclease VII small subunit
VSKEDMIETFEELMQKLENCVSKLEEGGLSLDNSTQLYEDGMKLAVEVSRRLAESDLKITNIRERYHEIFAEIDNEKNDIDLSNP